MKKVWVILFLVPMVVQPGCRSTPRARNDFNARPGPVGSGKTYFWDKDLRPTLAMPATPARSEASAALTPTPLPAPTPAPAPTLAPAPTPAPVPSAPEPVARAPIEPIKTPAPAATTAPAEVVTTSVEPVRPIGSGLRSPVADRVAPVGHGLMSLDEAGGHVFSFTYPQADFGILQVEKTMPQEVRLNTEFSYTIKVTNLTETMLSEIVLTETVSPDFQFKGADPSSQVEDSKLAWRIDSLGPKATKTIRITGVATAARPLEQSTALTHTIRDASVVKVVEPTLEVKRIAPAEALLCEPIPVDFVVTNTGTGTAQNVQITDNLPAGMQTADGKSKVVLESGALAAGETRRFSVKLRASKTGTYMSKAIATSAAGLQAESEPSTTTIRQPVLTITKAGPKFQYLGRPVAYEITVLNKGDGPAQNTIIEDVIPPGVTGIEATMGAQFSGTKLIWELGTLEPNTSKKVRVSYTPSKEGDLMGSATASAYCAEPVTDSAKTSVTGIAAVRIEVIDQDDPVEVGNTTTYVITATNEGSAADSNIRIVCQLDDKLQYVSSAGSTAGSLIGKTVSFAPLRNLDAKAKATWRVVVKSLQAGDVRFKVSMHTDQLALPIESMEATHFYQQTNGQ